MPTHDRERDRARPAHAARPARADRPTRRASEAGAGGLFDLHRDAGNAAVAQALSVQRQQIKADDEDIREEE